MRVASYNIRNAIGLDWRHDPDRIVDVIGEIDADVVVLQEADKRVGSRAGVSSLDRLEKDLGLTPADVTLCPLSHGWQGNAIFVKAHLRDHVPARVDLPSIEPRGAVSVQLNDPPLKIIGVHLGLTLGMRRKQMMALENRLQDYDNPQNSCPGRGAETRNPLPMIEANDVTVARHMVPPANSAKSKRQTGATATMTNRVDIMVVSPPL